MSSRVDMANHHPIRISTYITYNLQLYDLMIMAVKHQVLMSRNPRQLVMVTLNHLDAIRDFVAVRNTQVVANVQLAYDLLLQVQVLLKTTD